MIPDFTGDYISIDSTQDGDICTIIDEGKTEYNENFKKHVFSIGVKLNDKNKIYSPNDKAGRALQDAFGRDSRDWIGHKFQIFHIDKRMVIKPIKD